MTTQSVRMPYGLWDDFQEALIIQGRAWLKEVARELGLPAADLIRLCIGKSGVPQAVLIAAEPQEQCPWFNCLGDGLWYPCQRQRLRPTAPCQFHERPSDQSQSSLLVDGLGLGFVYPYSFNGKIYWTADEPGAAVFREDGTVETAFRIAFFNDDGERKPIIAWS